MSTQKAMGRHSLIDRLTAQVGDRGMALKLLESRGHVYPGTDKLTPEGRARDAMTAEERAIDRATKRSGKPASRYKYSPTTNRATLRKSASRSTKG